MGQKTVLAEDDCCYSVEDLDKANKLVREIKVAMRDPAYRKAAKAFYKQHTGETMRI